MSFSAAICPKCEEYILAKDGVPFLICPMCNGSISAHDALERLKLKCNDKDKANEVIGDCIALELQYGPQLPYLVLATLCDNFPKMEEPAFLLVRLSNFDMEPMYLYLDTFAKIKSNPKDTPWVTEFLDTVLLYKNMGYADLLSAYIENKCDKENREKYLKILEKLRKEYTDKSASPKSTMLLYWIYICSSVINILVLPIFMVLKNFNLLGTFSVSVLLACTEVGLMFWHNKVFGNRLSMTDKERLFMVIFLCSLFVALGAGVVGGMIKI
jgi:hypothetical protein